jgi:hypothetical protein
MVRNYSKMRKFAKINEHPMTRTEITPLIVAVPRGADRIVLLSICRADHFIII